MSKEKLLHIATIGKTVGIKGDLKLHIKSDFPEQFVNGATFFISEKADDAITLNSVNLGRGTVKIQGYDNPESAKRFTNKKLYTTIERTRKECHLEDGEFFWFDLEGCDVVEDGKLLGIVEEIDRLTITNYLKVRTSKELIEKGFAKTFLIPYHEPFVINTDIDKKIITASGAMDILEAS